MRGREKRIALGRESMPFRGGANGMLFARVRPPSSRFDAHHASLGRSCTTLTRGRGPPEFSMLISLRLAREARSISAKSASWLGAFAFAIPVAACAADRAGGWLGA